MVSNKAKRIIRVFTLAAILLFIVIQFTQTIGLAARGFDSEEILKQYFFYSAPAIGFLLGILLFFGIELFITKGDDEYGNSLAFNSQGETPAMSFWKRFSTIQFAFLWMIIFALAGLVSVLTKQESFTGLAVLPQQFTAGSSILFSTALVVVSENLGAGFTVALLFFLLRVAGRKYNMSAASFKIISWTIFPLIVGTVGLGNHLLRYSNSEIAKMTVFVFWTILGLVTILTGSIIPGLMMHASNNVFIDLARFFSSDTLRNYTIMVVIGLIVIYVLIYRKKLLGKGTEI
jgi:hypothetical protein